MTADPAFVGYGSVHGLPGRTDHLDELYAADVWRAEELGIRAPRGKGPVNFSGIAQPWLREAVKCWARQRLAVNSAFATLSAGALALKRFSSFLAACEPPVTRPDEIDRTVIERYLAWLSPLGLSESTKRLSRVFLRTFLEENRRYRWVETIPADAVVYHDELSTKRTSLPRFVPEFVMGQLEAEDNLARLSAGYRHLVVLVTRPASGPATPAHYPSTRSSPTVRGGPACVSRAGR